MGSFVSTASSANNAELLAQGSLFSPLSGSGSTSSSAVLPERLTAQTDKDRASQALGTPLPAVIGTGRVEGIYFIGGVVQIDTVTTTTTTTVDPPEGFFVSIANDANEAQLLAQGAWLSARRTTTINSSTSSQTATKAGYVLAYDFWERGYDLIRLEIDGKVVYDTENQVFDPTVAIRYYGGRQTAIDPIVSGIVGANPGAYTNMVMVFIEGYPADTPPSISAVISNAADDGPESAIIEWVDTAPDAMVDHASIPSSTTAMSAYDIGAGVLYQLFVHAQDASLTAVTLVVLDVGTNLELYRVSLADSGSYLEQPQFVWAIRGGDYVIVKLETGSDPPLHRIYNTQTGEVIAEYEEDTGTENISWDFGTPFQSKHVMFGPSITGSPDGIAVGMFDPYEPSITIFHKNDFGVPTLVRGRTTDTTVSAFARSVDGTTAYEYVFNGTELSVRTVGALPVTNAGLWYDPDTGYLITQAGAGGSPPTKTWYYLDPDDGSTIATWVDDTYPTTLFASHVANTVIVGAGDRFWPKEGFIFATENDVLVNKTYIVDIRNRIVSIWATGPLDTDTIWYHSIFDQLHGLYIEGFGDDTHWTVHRLPSKIPGLIDLQDAVTDVMYLAGFGAGDLTFNGFDGLTTYGFVIAVDTNIQSAVKTLSDIYDFYWCDTGSGFVYKKPGTDGALTIDAIIAAEDVIERSDPVQSSDEGDIRTPSSMELEYISKENAYKPLPASFSMTTGVLNSITTPRFSTPVLFNDAEAKRLVTEKFFQAQEQRRGHSLVVVPDNVTLLPGDIVSFPSGSITYTTVIDAVAMDFRNMSVELGVTDFQTEVETTINTVSNTPPTEVLLRFASIYIHLDMPLLVHSHDLNGAGLVQYGMVAARTATWTGGAAYRGTSPTNMEPLFDQVPNLYAFGVAQNALGTPADPFATTDNSTVTIRIINGATTLLVDHTETEVLAGANLAAIGKNGRWELVGFTTVVVDGFGDYVLSGFVRRGYHGSEVWASSHAAGDYFILLSSAVAKRTTYALTDLDDTFYFKAVGFGQNPAVVGALPYTIPGVAETPYAVRNIAASSTGNSPPNSPPDSPPDGFLITWDYRSRVADGLNPTDHGEETLAFEIDILSGDSPNGVKRTLTSTTNSVTYSGANIISDFGGYPTLLGVRVYMMSAIDIVVPGQIPVVPGRGYASTAYLFLSGTPSTATFDSEILTFDRSDVTFDRT